MVQQIILDCLSQLKDVLKDKQCVLYGAGYRTGVFLKYSAMHLTDIEIRKILVSQKKGNPNEIVGIPVQKITDYKSSSDVPVIVCPGSWAWNDITAVLDKCALERVYYLGDKLYDELYLSISDNEYRNIDSIKLDKKLKEIERKVALLFPRAAVDVMVLNILNHCNLRCKGCNHFSCIADEYYVSVESIEKDLKNLSNVLESDYVTELEIQGGETLLHPQLLQIMKLARTYFPYAIINISTNGTLLLRQDEQFWKKCRDFDISLLVTKYPIDVDYQAIEAKAAQENVCYGYVEEIGDYFVKQSFKYGIDLKGRQDPSEAFISCSLGGYVLFVMEGKLYPCPFSYTSSTIFNKKFNQNLRMIKSDYLVISEIKNKEEIFSYLSKPKNYCRYCRGEVEYFPWTTTKGEMSEWV